MKRKEIVDAHSGRYSHVSEFSIMARRSCEQFNIVGTRLEAEFNAVPRDDPRYMEMLSRTAKDRRSLSELGLTTIVFAACAIEAFIYDYGVRYLGETLAEQLDRLDVVVKYEVFPKLVTGTEFPKGDHAYGKIKHLVKNRNSIVHYKSSLWAPDDVADTRMRDRQFAEEVNSAIATLVATREVFRQMHPADMSVLALTASVAGDARADV